MSPSSGLKHDARYTWADYCSWSNDERWELIGGVAYAMSPAPSTSHQRVARRLLSRLETTLAGSACDPFSALADVKLSDRDLVQPDILAACDPAEVTPSQIEGAPDLVVEVLSPGTAAKDLRQKKALYERSGGLRWSITPSASCWSTPCTIRARWSPVMRS